MNRILGFPPASMPFMRDQFAAARDRARHREALQRELEILRRQINQHENEADRLRRIQAQIEAQLARVAP